MSVLRESQLAATIALIRSEPVDIVLMRKPASTVTLAGDVLSSTVDPLPLAPQRVALMGRVHRPIETLSAGGQHTQKEYVIIGVPEAHNELFEFDVQEGDTFTVEDHTYVVYHVDDDRSYQVKAEAKRVYG